MQMKRYIPCLILLFLLGSFYITSCNSRTEGGNTSKKTEASENLASPEAQESAPAEEVFNPLEVQEEEERRSIYPDNAFQALSYGYMEHAGHTGSIETFTYTAQDYSGSGNSYEKCAKVYLPYGYDPENEAQQYNVLYLLHGSGENEEYYFGNGESPTYLQILLDNMIENGKIEPCIVCTPTYQNEYCSDEAECRKYFPEELVQDLIPAFESAYATYYEAAEENAIEKTRLHRALGGFEGGADTVWWGLTNSLHAIAYFMPMSGESCCSGTDAESDGLSGIEYLEYAIQKQGMDADDFLIYSGCGGAEDGAMKDMKSQTAKIQEKGTLLKYCDNFSEGNFYHEAWQEGACDLNTIYRIFYNALPKFFGLAQEEYLTWAEGRMQTKEDTDLTQKKAYTDYGKWEKKTYYSQTAGRKTSVNILLPPGYSRKKSYPVLYALHGYWEDEDWMASDGIALQKMLANLMDQGKAEPMIVVSPYIYCNSEQKKCSATDWENSLAYDNFKNDLLTDLIPYIEEHYPVKKGKENTAVTGFSMGGRVALQIGFSHPESFGYIGAACPASGLFPETDASAHEDQMPEEEMGFSDGNAPYLMYITGAEKDRTVGRYPEEVHHILLDKQVSHLWNEVPKLGHEKKSLRVHLNGFLQTLFKAY